MSSKSRVGPRASFLPSTIVNLLVFSVALPLKHSKSHRDNPKVAVVRFHRYISAKNKVIF